jgi:hypothetical protein
MVLHTNLLGALCLVENAREEIAIVRGLPAAEIGVAAEEALLRDAVSLLPRLPLSEVDVLVVRHMGKEISGTGMDTNVLGRLRIPTRDDRFGPLQATLVAVLDLTDATHGHASGVGLADVTTARLVEKIDWAATYTNAVTAGLVGIQRHALPVVMADDRRALEVAVRCCGRPAAEARICFIESTAHLERFFVTTNLAEALAREPTARIGGEVALAFDDGGVMRSPWALEPASGAAQ